MWCGHALLPFWDSHPFNLLIFLLFLPNLSVASAGLFRNLLNAEFLPFPPPHNADEASFSFMSNHSCTWVTVTFLSLIHLSSWMPLFIHSLKISVGWPTAPQVNKSRVPSICAQNGSFSLCPLSWRWQHRRQGVLTHPLLYPDVLFFPKPCFFSYRHLLSWSHSLYPHCFYFVCCWGYGHSLVQSEAWRAGLTDTNRHTVEHKHGHTHTCLYLHMVYDCQTNQMLWLLHDPVTQKHMASEHTHKLISTALIAANTKIDVCWQTHCYTYKSQTKIEAEAQTQKHSHGPISIKIPATVRQKVER